MRLTLVLLASLFTTLAAAQGTRTSDKDGTDDGLPVIARELQELLDHPIFGPGAISKNYIDGEGLFVQEDDAVQSGRSRVFALPALQNAPAHSRTAQIVEYHQTGDIALAIVREYETGAYQGRPGHREYLMDTTWQRRGDIWMLIAGQQLDEPADPLAITLPAARLAEYAGRYQLEGSGDVYDIAVRDGRLVGNRPHRGSFVLNAEAADVFFIKGYPRTRQIFQRDAEGHITGLVDRRDGHDVAWPRSGAPAEPFTPDTPPALSYKDTATGLVFYVESDGRHVVALAPDGHFLWVEDPFLTARLELYRTPTPQIRTLGAMPARETKAHPGTYIAITYNSSQSGLIDEHTGEFIFLGQN